MISDFSRKKISSLAPKKRILIVEDDEILSEFFSSILRQKFNVKSVFSADEAILAAEDFFPDLIWLDILLGEHSAFALLNELKSYADFGQIPVVICSSVAQNLGEELLEEYGVARILDKNSMVPREILRAAEEILR